MDDDGLRPCAQGAWCASATTAENENGEKVRVPERGPRAFCRADQAKIAAALDDLPDMYARLAAELGTPVRREAMVHSVFGPKVPLRADVDETMARYAEILVSWHERVADVARLTPPGRGRPHVIVREALKVLTAEGRLDILLALDAAPAHRSASHADLEILGDVDGVVRPGYVATMPDLDGGDAGLEILMLHRRSKAILGETRERPVELLGVPCRREDCDMLALQRAELPSDPGDDPPWSVCACCGDTMSETEYRRWTQRYARWWEDGGDRPILEGLPEAS